MMDSRLISNTGVAMNEIYLGSEVCRGTITIILPVWILNFFFTAISLNNLEPSRNRNRRAILKLLGLNMIYIFSSKEGRLGSVRTEEMNKGSHFENWPAGTWEEVDFDFEQSLHGWSSNKHLHPYFDARIEEVIYIISWPCYSPISCGKRKLSQADSIRLYSTWSDHQAKASTAGNGRCFDIFSNPWLSLFP